MITLKSLLFETRIISTENSLLVGDITVYHGTTWTIAQNAKKGELKPINITQSIIDLLINRFGESPEYAQNIVKKSLVLRRSDPPRLFLTPNKASAIGYAKCCSPYGGESTVDVLGNYFSEKRIPFENIAGMIQTKEPALITITIPIKLLLTHPHWNTPAISRLRTIIQNTRKYEYRYTNKEDVLSQLNIELFVDMPIPKQYIQRIDKL